MTTTTTQTEHDFRIERTADIAAPADRVFAAVLEEWGPGGQLPDGQPFPFVLEAWPGGRWYRDLGHNTGHLWGHVQVIKPPTLLELCGPMFMSYAAINHLQFRLTAGDSGGTRLTLVHCAFGQMPPGVAKDCGQGWDHGIKRIRQIAERRQSE